MKYKTKIFLIAIIGLFFSLFCFIYAKKTQKPMEILYRPESGYGDELCNLQVEIDKEYYPLSFTLLELPYEEAEVKKLLQNAKNQLEKLFLKENESLDSITSDLNMPDTFPNSEIAIEWYLDSWDYVDLDGTVKSERVEEEVWLQVQAILSLQEMELSWEREICICPLENPSIAKKLQMLQYQLEMEQEQSSVQKIVLPKKFKGETLIWYGEGDTRWLWMLLLTIAAVCAMLLGQKKDDEKQRKKRERSMQLDYPEIVSRLSLYMGAGISTRKAWERIVATYEGNEKKEPKAAYEEMKITLHEMQSGVSEATAYERFGNRCRMPAYLKLGTLLSQNLRRGTKNLASLLEEESREAFEDRKAFAKKLGEECESKLLLPMGLLLLTVLIMIMYPAVVSFQM